MGAEHERLKEILAEAAATDTPEARAAYLDTACRGDADLRRQVEALLAAHEHAGDFLRQPIMVAGDKLIGEGPGTVIGRYKLLQEIGEGGFGLVFMAEQFEPVRRKVALKIIKAGMDTREVIARFEVERQALALMDHPNIARVLDAGATESGRPYFVMELVKGIRITDYCDQNNLSTEQRLNLFIKVCHAVQHAHQKGIIHRDLKPSNVMITLHDGEAVPKVIDFGVAKATGQRLTEKTLFTRYEQMIGTPAYMSPEQAQMSGLDVDTRTDIYALGVLLYELLTGVTPIDKDTLARVALEEVRRMIRETEPPKPSTRLHTMGEKLTEVAKHRDTEGGILRRSVRGDLDWIVMKALEKDRGRRYATANDFAEDVQRHLAHQPVLASPPSTVYRARKFVQRHRVAVAMAAVVALALAAGLSLALVGLRRALKAEAKARSESAVAEAMNEFLQQDLLRQASPTEQPDREVKLRALLDRASMKVGTRFKDKPLVEAEIRVTLSETYRNLGEYTNARVHLERALEVYRERVSPEDRGFLKARKREADLLLDEGRYRDAQSQLEQLLPLHRRQFGPEHQETLEVMMALAISYEQQGQMVKEQDVKEKVLSVSRRVYGSEHPLTLRASYNLAIGYMDLGKPEETRRLLEELLPVMRRVFGPEHLRTLIAEGTLPIAERREKSLQEIQKQYEELLPVVRRVAGAEHPCTLRVMGSLVGVYQAQEQWAKAKPAAEELVRIRERVLGTNHPATLSARLGLIWNHLKQGDLAEAQRSSEEFIPISRRELGGDHFITLVAMHNLASIYSRLGKQDEAQKLRLGFLADERRVFGPADRDTLNTVGALVSHCGSEGDWSRALAYCRELIEAEPDSHWHWYRAHAAALVAGQADLSRELAAGMLHRFGTNRDAEVRERVAKSLLLSSDRHVDVEAAFALMSAAYQENQDSPWFRMGKGIAEYRRAHYAEADTLLEQPRNSPELRVSCLADYFLAMVRHQQGEAVAARSLLETANRRFAEVLNAGRLPMNAWDDHCRNLIVRAEAERLILGREISPPVTAESLASAGKNWQHVSGMLRDGVVHAEKQEWPEARDAFAQALNDGAFVWHSAEQAHDCLSLRMAASFRKAQDNANHDRLCRLLLATPARPTSTVTAERYSRSCLLNWHKLAPEVQQDAIELARFAAANQIAGNTASYWSSSARGMAEYRAGDYKRALEFLLEAEESNEVGCISAAMIYRAMALRQMGRESEAAKVLFAAEALLAEPYKTRTGASWWDLEISQWALDEARQMMTADMAPLRLKWQGVRKLFHDGFNLAQQGKWSEARDAYAQALTEGEFCWRAAEQESPRSCLALHMAVAFVKAGDLTNHERLCRLLLALQPEHPSTLHAERFAKTCFLGAKSLPPDLQKRALELARLAVDNRNKQGLAFWTCNSGGTAEYHAGDPERAIELLLEAEETSDVRCKGGAMVYRAMSLKRLGRSPEAVKLLLAAEELIVDALKRRTDGAWWDLDICELALEEGRQLMATDLADFRVKWAPVRKLLDDGFNLAQQRKWQEARDAYARALVEPAFDWLAAERASFDRCLSLQMAVTFVRTGDRANHERLCRLLFGLQAGKPSMVLTERHAKAGFLSTQNLPPDLQTRGLELARLAVEHATEIGPRWACHTGGMAEYRAGKFDRALELLTEAEKSDDTGCKGGAMVYRAMTLKQLGREAEAAKALDAAEELLAGPLKRRFDPYWWDLDICELALQEARQLIGKPR